MKHLVGMHQQQKIIAFLSGVICLQFLFTIYNHREYIFKPFHSQEWEQKYNESQWRIANSKKPIGDDGLYIHVGDVLTTGYDPSLINAEVPPLAKYLIGFFEKGTGYIGIYGAIFSIFTLVLLYLFNKLVFGSPLAALIPITVFAFDPQFTGQVGIAMLDLPYLCFLLLTFIFLLKKQYLWAGIAAGLFMATKSPFVIAVLYVAIGGYMFFSRTLRIKTSIVMLCATALVYLLVHLQYFLLGHSFVDFLKVQKYLIHFYQTGAKGILGAVFPLLLTGYWFTWFGKDGFIKDWSILWPITFLMSIWSSLVLIRQKLLGNGFGLQVLWLVCYFFFLMITPVFPRYLLLVTPFLYNLAIWGLLQKQKKVSSR